ncbi:MAG TPA: hypothetical protein VHD83_12590 [Puia sp.]|nr:hypothetical protein [Puia sp.]
MITRNNYEEFFLLYVDNELSPADRQAVESFVDEHPDLKEEWEVLLQCRISPDEMPSFAGKEELLRSDAPIHTGNYQEWFLSYIDNELDAPSRQAVIEFVRRHPEKNIELQQLQRTVSTPDPDIVFPNKELLYRKEEKRRIAWLPFARIAAAALILGAVGLLIFHPFRTGQSGLASGPNNTGANSGSAIHPGHDSAPAVATTSGSQNAGTTAHPGLDSPATATTADPKPAPALAGTAPFTEKKRSTPVTPRTVDPYYIQKKSDGGQQNNSVTPTGDQTVAPVMAKVDPVRPANTVDTDPGRDLAVVVPKTIDRNAKTPMTIAVAGDQTQHDATGNMNASFATQALLAQTSYPDDGSLEETASPRKNKLRGLFRKVTRTLEKSAAREDDDNKKVTIGGFQFALK